MNKKLLFTLLTTSVTLMVTHPTININLMPDAVIYTKATNNNEYCKLTRSFTEKSGPKDLQVCEYKCPNVKRNGSTLIHTTSVNNSRSCKDKIESP